MAICPACGSKRALFHDEDDFDQVDCHSCKARFSVERTTLSTTLIRKESEQKQSPYDRAGRKKLVFWLALGTVILASILYVLLRSRS
jgi:hypothetical protein